MLVFFSLTPVQREYCQSEFVEFYSVVCLFLRHCGRSPYRCRRSNDECDKWITCLYLLDIVLAFIWTYVLIFRFTFFGKYVRHQVLCFLSQLHTHNLKTMQAYNLFLLIFAVVWNSHVDRCIMRCGHSITCFMFHSREEEKKRKEKINKTK